MGVEVNEDGSSLGDDDVVVFEDRGRKGDGIGTLDYNI